MSENDASVVEQQIREGAARISAQSEQERWIVEATREKLMVIDDLTDDERVALIESVEGLLPGTRDQIASLAEQAHLVGDLLAAVDPAEPSDADVVAAELDVLASLAEALRALADVIGLIDATRRRAGRSA